MAYCFTVFNQIVSTVKEAVENTGTISTNKSRPKAAQLSKPAPYPAVMTGGTATATKQLFIKPGVDPYADERKIYLLFVIISIFYFTSAIYAPTPRKQSIKVIIIISNVFFSRM